MLCEGKKWPLLLGGSEGKSAHFRRRRRHLGKFFAILWKKLLLNSVIKAKICGTAAE